MAASAAALQPASRAGRAQEGDAAPLGKSGMQEEGLGWAVPGEGSARGWALWGPGLSYGPILQESFAALRPVSGTTLVGTHSVVVSV